MKGKTVDCGYGPLSQQHFAQQNIFAHTVKRVALPSPYKRTFQRCDTGLLTSAFEEPVDVLLNGDSLGIKTTLVIHGLGNVGA